MYLLQLLFIIICIVYLCTADVKILDAGLIKLRRGDVGMIFYITVLNTCRKNYHVVVRMIECCEIFNGEDRDCQIMQLIGGDMGSLGGNVSRNMSLIYPNLYLHDRVGQCLIAVYYRDATGSTQELKVEVPFNTTITLREVRGILKDYYHPLDIKICKTRDLDPLNECRPVDCAMKYLGFRNHFDTITSKCVRVPVCISDPSKALPNIAYVPISNKCRDMENALTPEDIRSLAEGSVQTGWHSMRSPHLMNMHCHHGKVDNQTGFCLCDPGWTSPPFSRDIFEIGDSEIHMCTISINPNPSMAALTFHRTVIFFGLLGVIILFMFVLVICVCILCDIFMTARHTRSLKSTAKRKAGGSTGFTTSSSAQVWHSSDFDTTVASSEVFSDVVKQSE